MDTPVFEGVPFAVKVAGASPVMFAGTLLHERAKATEDLGFKNMVRTKVGLRKYRCIRVVADRAFRALRSGRRIDF